MSNEAVQQLLAIASNAQSTDAIYPDVRDIDAYEIKSFTAHNDVWVTYVALLSNGRVQFEEEEGGKRTYLSLDAALARFESEGWTV